MPNIFILNGPQKGKSYQFDGNVAYIGRLPENEIQIKEKTVSRKHLRIMKKGDHFILRDLNSKNGTFIDGRALKPNIDYEVEPGTPVTVGKIIVSLGVISKEEIFSVKEMADLSYDFSSTAIFTTHKDRPLTQPTNMEFFYNVSTVLTESLDINEIMEKVLDYIFQLLKRIDRGVIILLDDESGEILSTISRSANGPGDKTREVKYSKTMLTALSEPESPLPFSTPLDRMTQMSQRAWN